MAKRKRSNKKRFNIDTNHIIIGIFTAILLLAFVRAQTAGVWHTAEETKVTIDGTETTLQQAADAGDLAKVDLGGGVKKTLQAAYEAGDLSTVNIGGVPKTLQTAYDDGDFADTARITVEGVEKPLQQAWDDGDFIQDLPEGLAVMRSGSGLYTCQAESCIATCQGKKVSLKQGESRYCGLQTWAGWSNYAYALRIQVAFGVNGWNINNCVGCTVGSYATERQNAWVYCIPGVQYCPTNWYSGNWDRVTAYHCNAGGYYCGTGISEYGKGWMYTPAISGLTPADWSTAELSFPQPPVPALGITQVTGYTASYIPLYCPSGMIMIDCVSSNYQYPAYITSNSCITARYIQSSATCMYLYTP